MSTAPALTGAHVPSGSAAQTLDSAADIRGFIPGQLWYKGFNYKTARTTGTNHDTITTKVRWWDGSGTELVATANTIDVNGTSDWSWYEAAHLAPAGAVRGRVSFTVTPGGSTTQHDIYLTSVRFAKTQFNSTEGAQLGTNVIDSGGSIVGDSQVLNALLNIGVTPTPVSGTYDIVSNAITLTSGSSWDNAVYCLEPMNGTAFVQFMGDTASPNLWAAGLTDDPTHVPTGAFDGLDVGIYHDTAGDVRVSDPSGLWPGTGGHTDATVYTIVYDGATVKIYADSTLLHTTGFAAGKTWYFKFWPFSTGTFVKNIKLGTFAAPDWSGNVQNRPVELTDGRVGSGLLSTGDIARDILAARANSSSLLRFTSGGLYTGDLNGTYGAAWGTNLTGRPTELTDGRIAAGLSPVGAIALADTRAADSPPSYYYGRGLGVTYEFKQANFSGSGSSGFGFLKTTTQWADASGGPVQQTLTDSSGVLFQRVSTGTATWGAWAKHYTGFNKPAWGADLTGRPTELTDGRVATAISGTGQLAQPVVALPILGAGVRYFYNQNPTYTANAGSPATATISMPAGALTLGSSVINYNAMSVGTTGTGGTNVTYNLYLDDMTYAGGTKTLVATTSNAVPYQYSGRIFMGQITVSYPTSGSGGGGGFGGGGGGLGCPWEEAFVHTKRGWVKAKDVLVGDAVLCLRADGSDADEWAEVTANTPFNEPCFIVHGRDSRVRVTVSQSTPITLRDGSSITPPQIDGHELPFEGDGRFWWEACDVIAIEDRPVRRISCGGRTFSAGDTAGWGILTHNSSKP